jgi:hypothetical protein
MKVDELKSYGLAISDLEGNWSPEFRKKITKTSKKIIMSNLSFFQKFKLLRFYKIEKKRSTKIDLSEIRAKGLTNEIFINQQLEYLAMFSALSKVLDTKKALEIINKVMDATAGEAMLQNTPTIDEIKSFGNNFDTFKKYFAPLPEASKKAGCHDLKIVENTENVFKIEITYCAWLELAKKMNIPEACLPNCYADDYSYPEYYEKLGIKYSRKGTLAKGYKCCDLCFEKI